MTVSALNPTPAQILRDFNELRPYGGFNFIMADPPWRFEVRSDAGLGKSADNHYPTMTIEDIRAMPMSALAAKDCVLWLWTTGPFGRIAMDVIEEWGFEYKTQGNWTKMTKNWKQAFGTGYLLRDASEPFLIATRGAPKTARNIRSAIMARKREHSRKPEECFHEAEKMMPDAKRIEVFSRRTRPGWSNWGNQADKFDTEGVTEADLQPLIRPSVKEAIDYTANSRLL